MAAMLMLVLFAFLVLPNIPAIFTQVAEPLIVNPCTSFVTCAACLSLPGCAWCSQEDFELRAPRCDKANHFRDSCASRFIMNPSSFLKVLQDSDLSDTGAATGSAIQLKPQELHLSLRPKEPVSFKLTFRQAEDYPVDLYYLMDLTRSMKQHKEEVAKLGHLLAESMNNITKNFRLGFGSFIDKVVMPYANMVPERLKNPCQDEVCISPYGFRNHLPLTAEVTRFTEEVSEASVSGNLDNAEGGFDAIMQVVVCKDKIKWNEQSRKIILFATDSLFHYAGDGKLGGIIAPNDEQCHLNDKGYYTESIYQNLLGAAPKPIFQDYPSLSQINRKVTENKVNLIFAVPVEELRIYEILSSYIEGATVGQLAKKSSNIVNMIRDQYLKIRSKVVLKDSAPSFINVVYATKCLGQKKEKTSQCGGLKMGTTVDFEVKVELTSCPERSHWNTSMVIYPVGLNEALRIHLDLLCQCECEKPENKIPTSPKCSGAGTFECGTCNCGLNHYGRECECLGDHVIRQDKLALCIMDNSSQICSGRGECVCGVCECYSPPSNGEKIYGEFCECDTFSCERDFTGRVCSGPGHGKCCGECICNPGWTGRACDCSLDRSSCVAPTDEDEGLHCSGHGECICGQCRCFANETKRYGGPYCEDCRTCTSEGRCAEFRPCVECQAFGTGSLPDPECTNCSFEVKPVLKAEEESTSDRKCVFKDENGCSFTFIYSYSDMNIPMVRVQENKECPPKVDLVWVIVIVAGGVFLVGLIVLLVVRLGIHVKDRIEYQAWVEKMQSEKPSVVENELYQQPVTQYNNPMYGHVCDN